MSNGHPSSGSSRPPFKKGSPEARALGRKGGLASKGVGKLSASAVEVLDRLAPLGILGLMDRLGLTGPSWFAWRVVAKILDGVGLTSDEMAIYTSLTGRVTIPAIIRTLWAIIGRRGGKSYFSAIVAVHAATRRYPMLAPGEKARVLLLAKDRDQASVLYDYADGLFREDPDLAKLVVGRTRTSIRLANRVMIQVATSSFRAVRGYTLACVVADETAFWWSEDDAANPDREILKALRPGLATIPGARLLCITTPFARQGAAWSAYQRYHGVEDAPVLVLNAPTTTMNPLIDQKEIAADELEDPEHAAAEWGGQWRSDKEGFVRLETLDARTAQGIAERLPEHGIRYSATVDAAGGTGGDSFTLSVQHVVGQRDSGTVVQDLLREWKPPFDPEQVVQEIALLLLPFGIPKVTGDKYGGGLVPSAFRRHGLQYDASTRDASAYYLDALACLNSGRCTLLDDAKLRRQFLALRRIHHGGGRTSVEHPPSGHDDLSNVTAMGLVEALGLDPKRKVSRFIASFGDAQGQYVRVGGPKAASKTREEFDNRQAALMDAAVAREHKRLENRARRYAAIDAIGDGVVGKVTVGAAATEAMRRLMDEPFGSR